MPQMMNNGKKYTWFEESALKEMVSKALDEYAWDMLQDYSKYLEKNGYLDTDWYVEEPTAIEKFKKSIKGEQMNKDTLEFIDKTNRKFKKSKKPPKDYPVVYSAGDVTIEVVDPTGEVLTTCKFHEIISGETIVISIPPIKE